MALFTISFKSEALHKQTEVQVLLPVQLDPKVPLKVLWALHGMTDDYTGWLRKSLIELYAEKYGICVVMPDADLSFYVDMAYGADYFTYISEELPRFLSQYFPVSLAKEDNSIAGNSMGGYGAFYIAMNCPDKFSTAISLSGPMRIDWIYRILSDAELAETFLSGDASEIENKTSLFSQQYQLPEALIHSLMEFGDECTTRTFKAMFGNMPVLTGNQYDLFYLAKRISEQKKKMNLMAYCGEQDYHYSSNISFCDRYCQSDLDYTLSSGPGSHNWFYWNECIASFMAELYE